MKAKELRQLTKNELENKLNELKAELFNLRFQLETSQLDNTARIKVVRREIARVKTVLNEENVSA